jgi:hypothetical protein
MRNTGQTPVELSPTVSIKIFMHIGRGKKKLIGFNKIKYLILTLFQISISIQLTYQK